MLTPESKSERKVILCKVGICFLNNLIPRRLMIVLKVIFVDAENVGLKPLDDINVSVLDKVLVFSNDETVKKHCELEMYHFLGGYPQNSNQADFYIIASLARLLSQMTVREISMTEIMLYSKDQSLLHAFRFQCELVGANSTFPLEEDIGDNVVNIKKSNSPEKQLLSLLHTPKTSTELQSILPLSKSDFTRVINDLIKSKRISRVPNKSKYWMRSASA
ncbi:hypothetical protein A3K86_10920 [Photobacterium jeanii]|uniref:Uncharacterized protein n=1 Tax=Photobacterium jeanii TaxID=858640 RepID=A0A178KH72_9GAMM|nr:hypothetical protein A3K86_10920 [Photobacterium jeanii]